MSKLGWVIGAVLVAAVGVFGWQAMQPAEQVQGHSMETPNTDKLAKGAPIVEVRLPAELSAKAQMGKRAFDGFCAKCHGENGAGQNGLAPPLVHRIYEPSHHGDMAFVLAAQNGVRSHHWKFGNMPPVEGLTRADVGTIVTYIRELQRENGIE